MLRLTELKLPLDHGPDALRDAVLTRLGIPPGDLLTLTIARRGYDARRRSAITLVYAVDVTLRDEAAVSRTHASARPPTRGIASPSTAPLLPGAPSSSAPAPVACSPP